VGRDKMLPSCHSLDVMFWAVCFWWLCWKGAKQHCFN